MFLAGPCSWKAAKKHVRRKKLAHVLAGSPSSHVTKIDRSAEHDTNVQKQCRSHVWFNKVGLQQSLLCTYLTIYHHVVYHQAVYQPFRIVGLLKSQIKKIIIF